MYGKLSVRKRWKTTTIFSDQSWDYAWLTFKNDKLIDMGSRSRLQNGSKEILEVVSHNDGEEVLEVPKAFLSLCEENIYKPPVSSHIKYV